MTNQSIRLRLVHGGIYVDIDARVPELSMLMESCRWARSDAPRSLFHCEDEAVAGRLLLCEEIAQRLAIYARIAPPDQRITAPCARYFLNSALRPVDRLSRRGFRDATPIW